MQKELRRLMRDPRLISSSKQTLLSRITDQAAAMRMPCYLVGGFVRDLLLNRPVNDLDVIVEGDAIKLGNELMKRYGGKLTAHPVFRTAIWSYAPAESLDLITARSESYEFPGALPRVNPATIEDDIRRRDFTINAMAIRLDGDHYGEFLDPLKGQNDLEHGIVRVLHLRSLIEDPTRIFRAVRYEQRYGFKIDLDTMRLINPEALAVLAGLSGERLRHELDLIMNEEKPFLMISRLSDLGIPQAINANFPRKQLPSDELLKTSIPGLVYDRATAGYLLWLMDLSVDALSSISRRMDFTSELLLALLSASRLKSELPTYKYYRPSNWVAALEKHPLVAVLAVYLVTREDALGRYLAEWRFVKTNITGNHLKERGLPPGPRYKEILSTLRDAWLDGKVQNEAEEMDLLEFLLRRK